MLHYVDDAPTRAGASMTTWRIVAAGRVSYSAPPAAAGALESEPDSPTCSRTR